MEGRVTEYKRELTSSLDGLEREIVSFLNSSGGELIIGIADDGSVCGIENVDDTQNRIAQRISENICPSCLGLFDIVVEKREECRYIIRIIVSAGSDRPYYLAKYGMSPKGCHYRVGASSRQMPEQMIRNLFSKRIATSLRTIISPEQNLSFRQLRIFYDERKLVLNDQFAQTLDFLTPDGKYNFIAYMMADNNHLTFKVAKYSGLDKCDLIETSEYGFCCLLKTATSLIDRLRIENRTLTRITDKYRIEKSLFEPIPVREAIINMLVHNDYTRGYTPVVELFSDRLELTSHGGLPDGLSEESFFAGVSRPRNREIMRIFHDVDLVEQLGSGMNRILRQYDKSIFEITDDTVKVVFRYASGIEDQSAKRTDEQSEGRTVRQSMKIASKEAVKAEILAYLRSNPTASYQEISESAGVVRSTAGKYVKELVESGLLMRSGNNRSGYWKVL